MQSHGRKFYLYNNTILWKPTDNKNGSSDTENISDNMTSIVLFITKIKIQLYNIFESIKS